MGPDYSIAPGPRWSLGLECQACGNLRCFLESHFPVICEACGEYPARFVRVPIRWVTRKTGFWFWQWEGKYIKKGTHENEKAAL